MFGDKFIYTMHTILHNFIKSIETNQKLEEGGGPTAFKEYIEKKKGMIGPHALVNINLWFMTKILLHQSKICNLISNIPNG